MTSRRTMWAGLTALVLAAVTIGFLFHGADPLTRSDHSDRVRTARRMDSDHSPANPSQPKPSEWFVRQRHVCIERRSDKHNARATGFPVTNSLACASCLCRAKVTLSASVVNWNEGAKGERRRSQRRNDTT